MCVCVSMAGLWGVVNNAGVNFNGDVELATMQQFEKITQVNYLGAVRVTKAFLPLIRQSQGKPTCSSIFRFPGAMT